MITTRKLSCAVLLCLLSSISSSSMAGTFTPEAGTTITSNSVAIGWTSTAPEQWVRAYNSSAEKIFDSGRLMSSPGQVTFVVASFETQLRVIFYEKIDGSWIANERTYIVAIADTVDTIPTGEIAVDSEYQLFDLGPLSYGGWTENTSSCPAGTLLTGGGCDRLIQDTEKYDLIHHRPAGGDVTHNTWSCIWQCADESGCAATLAAVQAICLSTSPMPQ